MFAGALGWEVFISGGLGEFYRMQFVVRGFPTLSPYVSDGREPWMPGGVKGLQGSSICEPKADGRK